MDKRPNTYHADVQVCREESQSDTLDWTQVQRQKGLYRRVNKDNPYLYWSLGDDRGVLVIPNGCHAAIYTAVSDRGRWAFRRATGETLKIEVFEGRA